LIGKDPSAISAKYRDLHKQIRTQTPEATDIDLDIARLHGDIRATNYVFAALISAMAVHRPAEARDVVDALRRTVPAQFRDHGLIRELLGAMDKARAAKRAKPDSA